MYYKKNTLFTLRGPIFGYVKLKRGYIDELHHIIKNLIQKYFKQDNGFLEIQFRNRHLQGYLQLHSCHMV